MAATAARPASNLSGAGPVPFWAATQRVSYDKFTSDSWTPGSSVEELFAGALADLKSYGFMGRLRLEFTPASGSGAGTFAKDGPVNLLSVLKVQNPNGHAVFDADSFGAYLLTKYGAYDVNSDPLGWPSASGAIGGTTGAATPTFTLYIPFAINEAMGVGALSDMDASGPYQIVATGQTEANIWETAPASTTPTITVAVGGEFYSLPGKASRVTGQTQAYLPPGLDRGLAVVQEFTKARINSPTSGVPQKIRRVGNNIQQVYIVPRDSSGDRIAITTAVPSGVIEVQYDNVPLDNIAPRHALEQMARRRPGIALDTGVLLAIDRRSQWGLALSDVGIDGGLDEMLVTAQTTDLTISATWDSTVDSLDVYVLDVGIANLVSGQRYAFAYGGQLLLPAQPSVRS